MVVNLIKNPVTIEPAEQKEPGVLSFPDVSDFTMETSTAHILEKFLPYIESLKKAGNLEEGSKDFNAGPGIPAGSIVTYNGEQLNGVATGKGVYSCPNGNTYQGTFA